MTEKYLYPGLLDNRINDGLRGYCRAEGLDERRLRCCVFHRSSVSTLLRAVGLGLKRSRRRPGDPFISDADLPG